MEILKCKESSAVQAHISILQGIINRMANNSANCKTWTITIVAAMLVLIIEGDLCNIDLWICNIPVSLFFFIDCYYLGLERNFINEQKQFVKNINDGLDCSEKIFTFKGTPGFLNLLGSTLNGIISFSTLPFYGFIIVFIYMLGK